ncbi:MAG TPA: APC family permease [Actinomycetota bacterium]|nr:APC family permease [Actinomycetota bacterium]
MSTKTQGVGVGGAVKRLLLGRALSTASQEHQLLPKVLALPVFASDQLSSVAYATEEMMLVLALAGASALNLLSPLGLAVAALLVVVIVSYRQTVRAYPRGGGSYIVARENLGTVPGLTAAAGILASYVLTVSVSVTAGAIAVTSAAPGLAEHKVGLATSFVVFITIANLRGVKEAGRLFAIPTYGFVGVVGITLLWGMYRCVSDVCPQASTASIPLEAEATLTLFLVLRAFSSGATALTGVEAIADGVQAFRRPQAKNAAATLFLMGAMSIPMFLGITIFARLLEVRVTHEVASSKSVLAQIGDTIFAGGPMFIVLQVFTAAILILAANTAYQDFPRLSSILARDRFMPSQFRNRGDRLVFSNGIVVLSLLAVALVWAFDANLSALIQLYVVGVFIALTLSQAGMVRRQLTLRQPGWRGRVATNGIGAGTTGLVLLIVAITRFRLGAWMVIAAVPVIIVLFLAVRHHYQRIGKVLAAGRLTGDAVATNSFVLLVGDFGSATTDAVSYLFTIRSQDVVALWVGAEDRLEEARETWRRFAPRYDELELLPGAREHPVRAVHRFLKGRRFGTDFITIVIPEVVSSGSLWQLVSQRSVFLLKTSLLFQPGIVVTNVPLVPGEPHAAAGGRPIERPRSEVIVPVSSVHDATVRAVVYAKSLQPSSVEAIHMAADPEEVPGVVEAWHDHRMDVPLVLVEAPFRDLGPPLLEEIRSRTGRGDTVVTVVLPELVPEHWWQTLLHNQSALFFKRILLFEPDVVVTSVPFHLAAPETLHGAEDREAPSSPKAPSSPEVR